MFQPKAVSKSQKIKTKLNGINRKSVFPERCALFSSVLANKRIFSSRCAMNVGQKTPIFHQHTSFARNFSSKNKQASFFRIKNESRPRSMIDHPFGPHFRLSTTRFFFNPKLNEHLSSHTPNSPFPTASPQKASFASLKRNSFQHPLLQTKTKQFTPPTQTPLIHYILLQTKPHHRASKQFHKSFLTSSRPYIASPHKSPRHAHPSYPGIASPFGVGHLRSTTLLPGQKHQHRQHARASHLSETPQIYVLHSDHRNVLSVWLLISAAMIFVMIVIGGITRLTESGLSITEWKPVTGSIPPRSEEEWNEEFEKYKDSPEYRKLNPNMNLEEFKNIYFWEWVHREWGRTIGLAIILPAIYFSSKGWLQGSLSTRAFLMAIGIGFQGLLGWFMVQSGLKEENFQEDNSVPRVSQYRLAAHLGAALSLYSFILWTAMDLKLPLNNYAQSPSGLKRYAHFNAGLICTTIFVGALVAGLDAGLIYNTWPLMGEQFIPPGMDTMEPKWKNLTENSVTVQFMHRWLGFTTWCSTMGMWAYGIILNQRDPLPRSTMNALHGNSAMATLQALLGITTLISFVPVSLGASHQAGAVGLLSAALLLMHRLKNAAKIAPK